ncbi:uncharacterized protein LOC103706458 isoform X1 [Phoenix dactylifera]|uniref:Uncharacterized protein LOC103706458 isoform X1 n=1 Tax=Phoenix dactylifera TaxID=42345 RepID=A0A8B7BZY5_PHODC|nr:uncharacterized protein LOC103706458 isoform X1 [Phoenix dactylifera]
MAAVPKDLRPRSGDRPDVAADQPTASSSRKVKLLCSYGGKILPRPSDGALRYAGGDTRIITVRRDSTFPEIVRKMADAFGGPTLIRYQLPGEDLDSLVSVSNPEDLENMMEESDKLAQDCPDGSIPKLRVFLFPPSDLSANSSSSDLHVAALQYIEAVNGLNDSIASLSSMQAEAATDGGNEGISPALLSPTAVASNDPSRLVFGTTGVPVVPIPDAPRLSSAPCSSVRAQILNSSRSELPPPVAPYVPQGYVETQHAHITNPQSLGMVGVPQPVSVLGVPAMHTNMAPPTSQVNSTAPIQTRVDTNLEENPFGGRLAQLHGNPNYKPLSQLPPLPQVHLQPQNGEQYGLGLPLPSSQGETVRFEDCNFSRKPLPYAHSDTHGNASGSAVPETGSMLQSHSAESMVRLQALPKIVTGAVAGSGVETQAESVVPAAQLGACWFTQVPDEIPRNHERLVLPNAADLSHAKVFVPAVSVGLPGNKEASASYGMYIPSPQSHHEAFLQGQVPQSMGLPQYHVKQDVISKPFVADAGPVGKSSSQEAEQVVQDSVPVVSHGYVKPIDGMMEALHASPSEVSSLPEQWKPAVPPATNTPNDLRSKNPIVVESSHLVKPQVGGNVMPISNAFINSRIIPDGNTGISVDPLPSTSSGITHLHNVQLPNNSRVLTTTDNDGAYPYYFETGVGPVIPNEQLLGAPKYSCTNNCTYSDNTVHKIPSWGCKSEDLQFHPNEVPDDVSITAGNNSQSPLSATGSYSGNEEQLEEKLPLDSLFCNEDPRKIVGNMHGLPPRPKRVPSKESVTMKSTENHSVNSKGSHVAIVIEEGGFDHPHNSLNKDSCMEPVQPPMTGDEHIKQDVGAFAEGIAASTPQSSEPPVPDFFAHEPKESGPSFNKGTGTIKTNLNTNDQKSGVMKSKQSDKILLGFPNADDIGRMQIIKNSDLEELRELGSGTFGTVYHGKWRGSDVAIKRINDRYFSGKPSEQERMRADFWNEACKLADLHHPNVVAFYGVVLDGPGGSVATVTEYMVSGSLRHALQKNDKPLDRRKRLLIAMDVAFGMEYLHSKKIIHFDLKSDNLLVNLRDPQRPICKVCDLGLSKVKCQTLISGGVRGTLPWMAPELLSASNSLVSEKVDVFSFGIVMWELLTGEEPYADLHYGAIIGGIVSNTLRPPVPESCDPDWRSLMEQCWSAEASERPSFTEIASRLRSMAATLPPDQATHTQQSRQRNTND